MFVTTLVEISCTDQYLTGGDGFPTTNRKTDYPSAMIKAERLINRQTFQRN